MKSCLICSVNELWVDNLIVDILKHAVTKTNFCIKIRRFQTVNNINFVKIKLLKSPLESDLCKIAIS